MTSKTIITIPASTMVGAMALVLGRAEFRLGWGAVPGDALTHALQDHPVGLDIEAACRTVWRIMVEPSDVGQVVRGLRSEVKVDMSEDRHRYEGRRP